MQIQKDKRDKPNTIKILINVKRAVIIKVVKLEWLYKMLTSQRNQFMQMVEQV